MNLNNAKKSVLPIMNLVRMQGVPILDQLHLEERLLRCDLKNWCIVNVGTPQPTIVMGISGKPSELINIKSVIHNQVPVIRRFTGGGTVIVDKETIFVTLICNREAVPLLQLYPQPIMSWTGTLYQDALRDFGKFSLRENDYVFDNLKFGGNAQSITKNKWIHHTSFLWDYDERNMEYLKHPQRTPKYRSERSHIEFLCRMKDIIPSKSVFIEKTLNSLQKHFVLQPIKSDDISNAPYAPSSRLLTRQELEHDLLSTGT
ncbi:putative lipoate-protein ligase A [Carex littledalei]|uniref:Putative lipoate-protein ligase A n=1 Tax=Carex littledalei TaxID=544730 RepID=A0A833R5M2_9POAL|nr:putative lipoate-protein ligase A [Carex littledalei]